MIRGLSLWQPWAQLVALEHKRVETRSWQTSYRGWVAIHAAKKWASELKEIARAEPFASCLGAEPLQFGGYVAIARLAFIVPTEEARISSANERAFGDYSPGRFAWRLMEVRPIEFLPARGQQGLWEIDPETTLELRVRYARAGRGPE